MSLLIVGLDNTIVNVALPSIGRELHATVSGLQWTVDAYTMVIASLLLLAGSTADRFGRRRIFQLGLLLFTLGSLLCSLAPNLTFLVLFRMLQAVGGSMLNPVAMSIIRNTFEDPRERAQAIGLWGATVGLSLALGPVVGGALVGSIGWRSIFWINIPVGLAAIVLTALFVPESRAPHARRFDPIGQLLVITLLASLTYAIIEGPSLGWLSAPELSLFALVAASLVALLWQESHRTEPLIELRFFRSVPFSGATVIAVSVFAALGGYLFLNTLYLQEVRGLSAFHAGLFTLPIAAMTLIFAPLSGRLVGRHGSRVPLVLGGVGIAVSSIMLTSLSDTTPVGWLLVAYFVFGVGFGLVNPPITVTAVSGMPSAQAGVASAVASTSRQIGQTLGVALAGAIAAPAAASALRLGLARSSHTGWWFTAGCGVIVLVLGLATTTQRAKRTARVASAQFGEVDGLPAGA
jgi:EmrB/QacA subfamily drug resistance transporter